MRGAVRDECRRTAPVEIKAAGALAGETRKIAEKNWTHLFNDGRRVSFDRRDGSVILYPDEDFHVLGSYHLGYAEGYGTDWTATAPDGTKYRASGRKDAANWLIERTAEERAKHDEERARGA